jgi:large subunit ribosomal protein L29
MKASQLRELTEEELQQKLSDLTDDLFKLRIRHSVAKLENPIKIREVKKDIARVNTLITQDRMRKQKADEETPTEAKR